MPSKRPEKIEQIAAWMRVERSERCESKDAIMEAMRAARIARALWLVWAVLLWNVVFDHVIVVAGREYIVAAKSVINSTAAARPYPNMDDWMRPAVTRGLWIATASAATVVVAGVVLLRVASARSANR
jgi:hypothetical protein